MNFDENFDRQKLMYHPREVSEWLERGITRGPIYTEMELCNHCNCRCAFCAVDYLLHGTPEDVNLDAARRILDQLHALGNKSVMFSGHGEPLLHPDACEIIAHGARHMSASVTTNGVELNRAGIELIDGLEWIRFSINAGNADNYAEIHGVKRDLFDRVLANVATAVERKRTLGLDLTIGSQLVLLHENAGTALELAKRLKDIGVDYFSVKPYSQHPLSEKRLTVDYSGFGSLEKALRELEDASFRIIYRTGSIAKVGAEKPYGKCYGTHFLGFVSANGDVWECNVFAGDPRFLIGNACAEPLPDIWNGPRRAAVLRFLAREMDLSACRDICRMDACNRYLWRLKHPWPHDNFV